MGPLNNLAKRSRRFCGINVKQRMSMMPRLYKTEVFEKYRNHDFSPTERLRKLRARFTFSAKMFLMFCIKMSDGITGFISKPNEKPHKDGKPASRSYSRACV